MKKRIIAMILSIVMVIGMIPASVFAAEADNLRNFTNRNSYTNNTFDDVQKDDWFYENVKSVYELGLMQGKGENKFDTESGITIAETLTIAARLHSIYFTGSDTFEASNPWYQVYADYCAVNGIASVNSDTYSQTATRAEFVMILANALPAEVFEEINKVAANAIPDVNINDTYGAAVYKMYRAGIMIGNDDIGTFAPSSEIKRSEVATIVTRMVDVSLRKSIQLGNEYTVTFNMNGHGKQIDPQTVVEGYTAEKPTDPAKTTYVFKGWYTQKTGGQQFNFDTPIMEDITLYARWEIDPLWLALMMGWMNNQNNGSDQTYTVTFDANGSDVTNLPAAQRVKAGECAVEPADPTKLIYDFGGWYTDSSCTNSFDFSTPITANITIYAKWDITIYSKPLDESHVKTGTLEFEGEEFEAQYVDNELIIVVKDGVSREYVEQLVAPYGGTIVGQIPNVGHYQIAFSATMTVDDLTVLASQLMNNNNVNNAYINVVNEYSSSGSIDYSDYTDLVFNNYDNPNNNGLRTYYTIDTPVLLNGYDVRNWGLTYTNTYEAREFLKNNKEKVKVGIIDTMFSANHEDLVFTEVFASGSSDGNDITLNPSAVNTQDKELYLHYAHGTSVAGVIGAKNNSIGISGIADNIELYGFSMHSINDDQFNLTTKFTVSTFEDETAVAILLEVGCQIINYSAGYEVDERGDERTKSQINKVKKEGKEIYYKC